MNHTNLYIQSESENNNDTPKTHTINHKKSKTQHLLHVLLIGSMVLLYGLLYFLRISQLEIKIGLEKDLNMTVSDHNILISAYFWSVVVLQIPSSYFLKKLDPEIFVLFGALIMGSGCYIFSISKTLTLAVIGRILLGLGNIFHFLFCSFLFVLAFVIFWCKFFFTPQHDFFLYLFFLRISNFFIKGSAPIWLALLASAQKYYSLKYVGFITGIALMYGNLNIFIRKLQCHFLNSYNDWRTLFLVICVFIIFLCVCITICYYYLLQQITLNVSNSTLKTDTTKSPQSLQSQTITTETGIHLKKFFRQWRNVVIALIYSLSTMPQALLAGSWLNTFLQKKYDFINSFQAADICILNYLGSAMFCLFYGYLSKKFENKKTWLALTTYGGSCLHILLVYGTINNVYMLQILSFFAGASFGVTPVIFACKANFFLLSVFFVCLGCESVGFYTQRH